MKEQEKQLEPKEAEEKRLEDLELSAEEAPAADVKAGARLGHRASPLRP